MDSPSVSTPPEHLSLIERLPAELVFKIFDFTPEAVSNLKLTSRLLQTRVVDYVSHPVSITLVERLHISKNTEGGITIWMHVLKPKSNLFDMRLKLHRPVDFRVKILRFFHEVPYHPNHYRCDINDKCEEERTMEHLRACMGTRVVDVICNGYILSNEKLLANMKIGILDLYVEDLTTETADNILDLINVLEVNALQLRVKADKYPDDSVKFLLDLASAFRSLHIMQFEVKGINDSINFLFGVQDFDWSRVIFEMFSRKLRKLIIDTEYPGYLPKQSVEKLSKNLPKLGDKVWFESDCMAYDEDLSDVVDDVVLEFNADDQRLIIKHSSRLDELFR